MENEDKKDFNAMFPPADYDRVMQQIPCGKVLTVCKIWEYFGVHNLNCKQHKKPNLCGRLKLPCPAN